MPISRAIDLIDAYNESKIGPVPKVSLSSQHSCFLKDGGDVYCFGANNYGQLGTAANSATRMASPTPTKVEGLSNIVSIAVGGAHTCALRSDGTVHCFGSNYYGELGRDANRGLNFASPDPSEVVGLSNVTGIAAGDSHTCAVRSDGAVLCFGSNFSGEIGRMDSTGIDQANPTPTPVVDLVGVKAIAAGTRHTCALKDDGTVFCFGDNFYGQLGTEVNSGSGRDTSTPALVEGLNGVTAIAAGGFHTCVLKGDGAVFCFGANTYGQLGVSLNIGTKNVTSTPVRVDGLGEVTSVSVGGFHTCALKGDGTAFCFGLNNRGQLGTSRNVGTGFANPLPIPVDGLDGLVRLTSTGEAHTCVMKADGRVYCFGVNQYGQLGAAINNQTENPNPAPVSAFG